MTRYGKFFLSVFGRGTRGQEVFLNLLVIHSCYNKSALRTTQVYSITVLDVRSLTVSMGWKQSLDMTAPSLGIVGEALLLIVFQHPKATVFLDSSHLQSCQCLCCHCHVFSDPDSPAAIYRDLCDNTGPTNVIWIQEYLLNPESCPKSQPLSTISII